MDAVPAKHGLLKYGSMALHGEPRSKNLTQLHAGTSAAALTSVSGPIEVRLVAENPSQATFEVSIRPLSSVPDIESKSLASTIRLALQPSLILTTNPRTLIQLIIQALTPSSKTGLKWDNGLIAAMINASTMALLNAGSIPMRGIVCAVAVARVDNTLLVDPSPEEMAKDDDVSGSGCFAFMFGHGVGRTPNEADFTCVWSNWRGDGGGEQDVITGRALAKEGARQVWEAIKSSIGEGFKARQDGDDHEMVAS
ncbi:exosome non-catalytic core subunit rrp46 [Pleurotus pulmonarius]|nr:exosome non-catalytic core subunit rrp46 [Pleurotus pulmonarius]KAF4590542.1 exosome non-catalytic core subunit rrp46 [Pleurotus pulmonarius]